MSRNYYDWAAIVAELQRKPGRWVLRFPDHPVSVAKAIRLRRHPALRLAHGRLEATVVNVYREPGESGRADIWIRYVSTPTGGDERSLR